MAVGRFQVMAVLQAARASLLGLPVESAHSWGLNRAIFYAAAKRGFKGTSAASPKGAPGGRAEAKAKSSPGEYRLGDEIGFEAPDSSRKRPMFSIGGKEQTEEEFEKRVVARFAGSFQEAWEEALDYVGHFDRETLESQSRFFSDVYRPKRDEFSTKWTEMGGGSS